MGFRNAPVARKLRTAPSGRRIEIVSTRADQIDFFTGDPQEQLAGELYVGITAGSSSALDRPWLQLLPPVIGVKTFPPAFFCNGPSRDGTVPGSWSLTGDVTVTNGRLSNPVTPLDLPMAANWAWLGAGYGKPKFYRDAAGATNVQGYVKFTGATTITTASLVGTLPLDYAPKNGVHTTYLQTSGFDWCRVDVGTDGTITITAYNASGIAPGNYFALNLTFHPAN